MCRLQAVAPLGRRPGGEEGIRTPGTIARTLAFQASPFDHSGTSPYSAAGIVAQHP